MVFVEANMERHSANLGVVDVFANAIYRQITIYLCLWREDYATAEELTTQEFQSSIVATGSPNGDVRGANACFAMATLSKRKGALAESREYYRLAIEGFADCSYTGNALVVLRNYEWHLIRAR